MRKYLIPAVLLMFTAPFPAAAQDDGPAKLSPKAGREISLDVKIIREISVGKDGSGKADVLTRPQVKTQEGQTFLIHTACVAVDGPGSYLLKASRRF